MLAWGAVYIRPGFFRVTRWKRGYRFENQKTTATQVWVRLYNLPLEYRHAEGIFSVARRVGIPLKIDLSTFSLELGIYTHVLLEIDFLRLLLEKVLVGRRNVEK